MTRRRKIKKLKKKVVGCHLVKHCLMRNFITIGCVFGNYWVTKTAGLEKFVWVVSAVCKPFSFNYRLTSSMHYTFDILTNSIDILISDAQNLWAIFVLGLEIIYETI